MPRKKNNILPKGLKPLPKKQVATTFLFEAAWEVCNQVGGIYTVIRSKVTAVIDHWGQKNYCLLGPYMHQNVAAVFDPIERLEGPVGEAVIKMREMGYDVHYGHWLIAGRPRTVLFNPHTQLHRLPDIKRDIWERYQIPSGDGEPLVDQVLSYNYQMAVFLELVMQTELREKKVIAHFHEWMAGLPIPILRQKKLKIATVFTTHATMLGRYLAMNDSKFYENLPFYNWAKEAKHFNIEPQVNLERSAAHGAHVFTTVSEVTARECKHLLGRDIDVILPNGLNIYRFEALHEFQNLHLKYKEKIHQFVLGHFFQSYSFDLNKTLYFFTSGRYEYRNKGFDVTLEALARLNYKLKKAGSDTTVVFFFITKKPYTSVNPHVLNSRALLDEARSTVNQIVEEVGDELFAATIASADNKLPDLNSFVDEYLRLRLRRTIQSWRTSFPPSVITHNLVDDSKDEILNFLRVSGLVNQKEDRVKVVFHPDFISSINPLFGMEYNQFVRGCHLGVFPSYYEPWGYTPLECIASGVPTVTSDLAGFGDYVMNNLDNFEEEGIALTHRKQGNDDVAAEELAKIMYNYTEFSRRERISLRNRTEASATRFDWENLALYYHQAYKQALERLG